VIPSDLASRIKTLLNPIYFDDEIDRRINYEMCPETGNWVFEHPSYVSWINNSSCNTLWIHGPPGSGKSFLASFIASKMPLSIHNQSASAFFGCDKVIATSSTNSTTTLHQSILAQLVGQLSLVDSLLAEQILSAFEAPIIKAREHTTFELLKLFRVIVEALDTTVVIIDAIDELRDWNSLSSVILRLADDFKGKFKLLLASRDLDAIRARLADEDRLTTGEISLDSERMLEDIQRFVDWRTRHLDLRPWGKNRALQQDIIDGAGGLILLAKFRIEALVRRPVDSSEQLSDIIEALPASIEDYYDKVIARILDMPEPDRRTVGEIFIWVIFGRRPLTFSELCDALRSESPMRIGKSNGRPLTRDLFEGYCHGLVVLRNDEACIAHGSVRKYLLDGALGKLTVYYSKPPIDISIQAGLGTSCLNYLSSLPIPKKPDEIWGSETTKSFPLMEYALTNWPSHVFLATGVYVPQLRNFLLSPQSLLWWRTWSWDVAHFGDRRQFHALQVLYHRYLQSLGKEERTRITNSAGPILPLRMTERQMEFIESKPNVFRKDARVDSMCQLIELYNSCEKWQDAQKLAQQVLAIQPTITERTAPVVSLMAQTLKAQGRKLEALQRKKEVYDFVVKQRGERSIQSLIALDNLALYHLEVGHIGSADECSMKAMTLSSDLLGPENLETAIVMGNRASILAFSDRLPEAIVMAKQASSMCDTTLGTGHPTSIVFFDNISSFIQQNKETNDAIKWREDAYQRAVLCLGYEHHTTVIIRKALLDMFEQKNDPESKMKIRRDLVEYFAREHGETNEDTLWAMYSLFLSYLDLKNFQQSKTIGERLVKGLRNSKLPKDNDLWALSLGKMCMTYALLQESKNALAVGEEALQLYQQKPGIFNIQTWGTLRDLACSYWDQGDRAKAIKYVKRRCELAATAPDLESDRWFEAQEQLYNLSHAEGDLKACYDIDLERLKARTAMSGPISQQTVGALMDLYVTYKALPEQRDSVNMLRKLHHTKEKSRAVFGDDYFLKEKIDNAIKELMDAASEDVRIEMENIL
jgi:tetratricopeptide (TPR) repeat protein